MWRADNYCLKTHQKKSNRGKGSDSEFCIEKKKKYKNINWTETVFCFPIEWERPKSLTFIWKVLSVFMECCGLGYDEGNRTITSWNREVKHLRSGKSERIALYCYQSFRIQDGSYAANESVRSHILLFGWQTHSMSNGSFGVHRFLFFGPYKNCFRL